MPKSRSRRTFAALLFLAASVAILNVTLWLQYRNTRAALAAELARRLESLAQTLAVVLEPQQVVSAWYGQTQAPAAVGSPPTSAAGGGSAPETLEGAAPAGAAADSLLPGTDALLVRDQLVAILEAAGLANVTLYDRDCRPFLDAAHTATAALQEDPLYRAEVLAALRGSPVHTPLYRSGTEYLMSAFAPLQGGLGFAVGVEADAPYFSGLRRLGQSLLGLGAGSVAVLIILGGLHARAQARLAHAEAAVQRAETLAAMGRMAAGIAHEIRNPLGIIRATASRLKKLYDAPDAPDEKFDFIADEVDRLSTVLDGYLGFARDEPPRLVALDWVPLVHSTLRLMQPELDAAHVTLTTDLPASCTVRGDAQRLRQLLMNLVLNAVQAMEGGGRLHVQLQQEDAGICLTLADTGQGIPTALHARVFEPFFTTREKGSGLGLAIVQRIVEEHAGSIRLGTPEAGGTRIEVRLPRP